MLNKAMAEIASLNDSGGKGTVNLKGRTYTNVSTRVEVLRKHLGLDVGIDSEILFPVKGVVFICRIKDKDGFVLATGHSYADNLQKDKSLEKLETVAIGRACAALGLAGGEYASDSEIESWKERYEEKATGIYAYEKTGDKEIDDKHDQWRDWLVRYPKSSGANLQTIEKAWEKWHDNPVFPKITVEQHGILVDQYNASKQQIEKGIK